MTIERGMMTTHCTHSCRGPCYGDETGCDIIFLAGRDEDIWRLPAHQLLLARENPVFSAMLSPSFLKQDAPVPYTIRITDVEGRALDNLLRFLYNEPVPLQSTDTALVTLQAADKYICRGLARVCISYLSDNLHLNNVLGILKFIRMYCGGDYQNLENLAKETNSYVPQANYNRGMTPDGDGKKGMGMSGGNNNKENNGQLCNNCTEPDSIELECSGLLHKCLEFVDLRAEAILASEEWEDLDMSSVGLILGRDTLGVKNELLVFSALLRWADKECKRQQLPLTPLSKRQVLRDSLFLSRYLTMRLQDFESNGGPAQSGLFTSEELWAFGMLLSDLNLGSVSAPPPGHYAFNNDPEKTKQLVAFASNVMPRSVQPFLVSLLCPRVHPSLRKTDVKTQTKFSRKKRRLPLIQQWLCLKSCYHQASSFPSSNSNNNSNSTTNSKSGNNNNKNNNNKSSPLNYSNHYCSSIPYNISTTPMSSPQLKRKKTGVHGGKQTLPKNKCGPHSKHNASAINVAIERVIMCWAFFFD